MRSSDAYGPCGDPSPTPPSVASMSPSYSARGYQWMTNIDDCVGKQQAKLYPTQMLASPGTIRHPAYVAVRVRFLAYMGACSDSDAIGEICA